MSNKDIGHWHKQVPITERFKGRHKQLLASKITELLKKKGHWKKKLDKREFVRYVCYQISEAMVEMAADGREFSIPGFFSVCIKKRNRYGKPTLGPALKLSPKIQGIMKQYRDLDFIERYGKEELEFQKQKQKEYIIKRFKKDGTAS